MTSLAAAVAALLLSQTTSRFRDGESPTAGYTGTRQVQLTATPLPPRGDPNTNYTALPDQLGLRRVMLLHCDLSAVPSSATVTAAELELQLFDGTTQAYEAFEAGRTWQHDAATWIRPLGGELWAQPGAMGTGIDHGGAVLARVSGAGTVVVPFTPLGLDAVQRWVSNPATNRGLVIGSPSNTDPAELASVEAANVAARPALTVVWQGSSGPPVRVTYRNGASPATAYQGCSDTTLSDTAALGDGVLRIAGAPEASHGLLAFDVSALPAGARVDSARLVLQVIEPSATPVQLWEVLVPWSEANATWQVADVGRPWGGGGATGPSDRGGAPLATMAAGATGTLLADLGAAGAAMLQRWVAAPAVAHGLLLTTASSHLQLGGRRAPAVSDRPALEVTWSMPGDAGVPPVEDGPFAIGRPPAPPVETVPSPAAQPPGSSALDVGCACGATGNALGLALLALSLALPRFRTRASKN